jgi:hypothetical protein
LISSGKIFRDIDINDNIKIDIREIWYEDMHWVHLAEDRGSSDPLGETVIQLRVPKRQ